MLEMTPLTTAEMNALENPRFGTIIYNTDSNEMFLFSGSVWKAIDFEAYSNTLSGLAATTKQDAIDELAQGDSFLSVRTATVLSDTALSTDNVILIDATANAVTVNLPTAAGITGKVYRLKAINITNTATLDAFGAQTIDGALTFVFTALDEAIDVISDGSNWRTF